MTHHGLLPQERAHDGTPSVITLGEAMISLAPQDGRSLTETQSCDLHIAGAESNVALYLADAGVSVSWISAVGTDPFGERLVNFMSRHKVDTSMVRWDRHLPTGVFFKDQGPDGTRVHYYRAGSAASAMSPSALDPLRELCNSGSAPEILHLSGITAALSPSCFTMSQSVLAIAKESGIQVSFDVNYRSGLWPVNEAAPLLQVFSDQADLVFVGLDEAQELWGLSTPKQVREFLPDAGEIVVKDGSNGATWFGTGRHEFVPTPAVKVVEIVGAGDAFAAGFIHARLSRADTATQLLAGHQFAERAMSSTSDFCGIEDFGTPALTESTHE